MIVSSIREKLLLFKHRYNMSQKEICREIDMSEQHFVRIMKGDIYDFTSKHEKAIVALFNRYGFYEALSDDRKNI